MNKTNNIWDKSIEVESNSYNWTKKPLIERSKKNSNADFIHIDLFSGCGGFSTGFEMAGFTSKLAIDFHPQSIHTIQKNHLSCSTILGDIKKVTNTQISDLIQNKNIPTVITAGVPCQGFSLSNRKRKENDKRNFLFKEFIRISKYLKPDVVVLENVSGLVSTGNGFFKKSISQAIESIGYKVYFSELNAANYGVPQLRRRVFFIGVKKSIDWLFPEKTHGPGRLKYVNVGDAILGDLPKLNNNDEKNSYLRKPTSLYQQYLRKNSKTLFNHKSPNHPIETINMIKNTKPGEAMYEKFKQRIRLHKDLPSPTQICGGIRPQFQFGHPTQNRGMSIRERARIQSFPDHYNFVGGLVQGRIQTGNAVPPLLAKALASQIKNVFNGRKLKGISPEIIQNELF